MFESEGFNVKQRLPHDFDKNQEVGAPSVFSKEGVIRQLMDQEIAAIFNLPSDHRLVDKGLLLRHGIPLNCLSGALMAHEDWLIRNEESLKAVTKGTTVTEVKNHRLRAVISNEIRKIYCFSMFFMLLGTSICKVYP